MDLLSAVNRILPKLGEHPVTNLNAPHSTVALILEAVDTKLYDVTARGWWFNEFTTKLYLSPENEILLPSSTLSFVANCGVIAIQRNGKLFNPETQTYVWDAPLSGRLVQLLPFEELPESAASLVWYSALVDTYVTDLGLGDDVRVWQNEAMQAEGRLQAEHFQQMRYSTSRSPRFLRLRARMKGH